MRSKDGITSHQASQYINQGLHDASYIINSVAKLQTQNDVKSIVLITHTVPDPRIITHDIELIDTWRFNSMGNSRIQDAVKEDYENKIKLWCFGHYHRLIDTIIDGIRYVSNPRGRGDTEFSQIAYYPKRVTITV